MAFQTGTVGGAQALLDALVTFATGSCGWTVHDAVASNDKVLTAVGTDSKIKMFYRISTHDSAGNFFVNAPSKPDRAIPGVVVNGYHAWNAGTHVGTNEFGRVGPFAWSAQAGTGTPRFHRYSRTSPFNAADSASSWWSNWLDVSGTDIPFTGVFDGARLFWAGGQNNTFNYADLSTMDNNTVTIPSGTGLGYSLPCWVYNATTDTDEVYFLNQVASGVTQFQKINTRTKVVTGLTNPAFTTPNAGWLVWDGGDFIYGNPGAGQTTFKRYSISGNTWTSLTATPVARATSFSVLGNSWASTGNAVYLPAAVTGLATDTIMLPLAVSSTLTYMYQVTGDTWTGTQTNPFSWIAATSAVSQGLYFDGKDELISHNNVASGFIYGTKTNVSFGTYTQLGQQSTGSTTCGMIINHYACKIRSGPQGSSTYWFSGDADGIMVAIKYNSRYYWMYFGRYLSFNGQTIAQLTSGASSGSNVTINVDASAGIDAGTRMMITDPATGLHEVISVDSIPNGTSIKATLQNSYTTGSKVGIDPAPFGCMSSGGWMTSALGPEGHFTADQMTQFYFQTPVSDTTVTNRNDPNPRGIYHLIPFRLYQPTAAMRNNEDIAAIPRLYIVSSTGLAAEDVVMFEGKQYKTFPMTETTSAAGEARRFAIPMS